MPVLRTWGAALALLTAAAVAAHAEPPAPPQPAPAKPAPAAPAAPAPAAPAPAAPAPKADNQVVTTQAIHAVVLPMKGSYMQHQSAFERLGTYLGGKGVSPEGAPFGRYFSDPSVPEADLAWEVGFQVPASVKVEAPFEIKDIPAAPSAVHVHRGSYEELGGAWASLTQWVIANGYRPSGPPLMVFTDLMKPEVEMRLPVEK